MRLSKTWLSDPEFNTNPYPFYSELRRNDPVHWTGGPNPCWVLTKYKDVRHALQDPRLSVQKTAALLERQFRGNAAEMKAFLHHVSKYMSLQDPPNHDRLRGFLGPFFTKSMIEGFRPHVQAVADRLLDKATSAKRFDIMADLAQPLSLMVIATILADVPDSDYPMFLRCAQGLARFFGGDAGDKFAICRTASQSITEMQSYFRDAIKSRRRQPRDDLLSMFLASQDNESVSDEELCAQCVLLITAGNVTTVDLIGNGCHAILTKREQRKRLLDDPDLLESAIEEMLRYDCPVQLSHRVAIDDTEFDEKVIKKGQLVFAVLGAANRDPDHFHDPDTFDIARANNDHLAFGTGIHHCIGLWLAKLEAQVAIWSLLQRLPTLRLAKVAPKWKSNGPLVRGFSSLPVTW